MIAHRSLRPADSELIEAAAHYDTQSRGLGSKFLDDVDHAIARQRQQPRLGRSLQGDLRQILLRRFPYKLIYAYRADELLIVAVAHQKRQPDYWHVRID